MQPFDGEGFKGEAVRADLSGGAETLLLEDE